MKHSIATADEKLPWQRRRRRWRQRKIKGWVLNGSKVGGVINRWLHLERGRVRDGPGYLRTLGVHEAGCYQGKGTSVSLGFGLV